MSEEIKKDGDGGGAPETIQITKADWDKVQEQITNLNKGIATSRDEVKSANEIAKSALDELETFKKGNEKKTPVPELSEEENKKFEAWAKANGIVTKADLEAERAKFAQESAGNVANTATTEFLEKHPEYDDDEMWAKVQEEFKLYRTPTDLAGYRKLLDKIHKELSGGDKDRTRAEVKAELKNKALLNLGGGGQGKTGDQEATIDALQEKYPSLSRGQIEARIQELQELYPSK